MKKLLIIAISAFAVSYASAQGVVTLANAAATAITNVSSGVAPFPRATVNVALYGSTSLGLPDDSSLVMIGARTNTFAPGLFSAGARNIGNAGDTVTLQVRAWSGSFATYEDAVLGADSNTLLGKSTKWEQITGGGSNPSQPITGAGRLTPFTVTTAVPEPSSIALGLLGLGAIALFRRRK